MKMIMVPIGWYSDIREGLQLMWDTPDCSSCETEYTSCRMNRDDRETICGSSSNGSSRSVKHTGYTSSKVHGHNDSQNQSINLSSAAIIRETASRTGLDGPTIESYPISVLGDSCSSPNGDSTCAICLCDYKPRESLMKVLECNHYFHADCIDKWLKLNVTCPVCRKTQKSSRKFEVGPSLF